MRLTVMKIVTHYDPKPIRPGDRFWRWTILRKAEGGAAVIGRGPIYYPRSKDDCLVCAFTWLLILAALFALWAWFMFKAI